MEFGTTKRLRVARMATAKRRVLALVAAVAPGKLGALAKSELPHSVIKHDNFKKILKGVPAGRRSRLNQRGKVSKLRFEAMVDLAVAVV